MPVPRALVALACLAATLASAADSPDLAASFLAECGRKAEAAQGITVPGKEGWLFLKNELRHLGAGKFWGGAEGRDPLAAIVDYKEQLARAGVEMVLVPVPPKAVIYPDMISDLVRVAPGEAPPRLDPYHQEFYRLLREQGVNVVDLTDQFLALRKTAGDPVYCRTDTHWSDRACVYTAQVLADLLKDKPWMKDVPRTTFASEDRAIEIEGDLLRAMTGENRFAPEKQTLRFVGTRGPDGLTPVEPDPKGPVVLMADSHGLVFHAGGELHARGAGLADQLALDLGFPVDLIAVRGSGATPARLNFYRRAAADPTYLPGKKVLIWCFSAREFTESRDWRKVPVTRAGQ